MRRTLRDGVIVSILGLGLGAAAWLLTGQVWAVLLVCVAATVIPLSVLRQRDDVRLNEADRVAARLSDEREQHQATRQFIQRLLDVVPMPIYVKDADSRVIIINSAQADQWGLPREEVIGNYSFQLSPDPERTLRTHEEDLRVLNGEVIYKEEHTLDGAHGQEQFRVITKGRCADTEGNYVIVCARFDTTRWRQAEREVQLALERETLLRRRNQDFIQRVLDVIPDPFYIKDAEGRLVMVNEAYAHARGYSTQTIIGRLAVAVALTPELLGDVAPEDEAVLRGETIDKEQRYTNSLTGEEQYRLVSKRPIFDMDGKPLIVVAHLDITRWKVAESKLARLAHEDELTGLPNRRHFLKEAERLISIANRHGSPLSLIIFDLDHFKQVNDRHGHVIGDLVLKEVARRFTEQLRSEDLPCRWGGEEFVVLLPLTDLGMATAVAERLRDAFASVPVNAEEHSLRVTISGGVAQKLASESLNDCLDRADKALYAAKKTGRNRFLTA